MTRTAGILLLDLLLCLVKEALGLRGELRNALLVELRRRGRLIADVSREGATTSIGNGLRCGGQHVPLSCLLLEERLEVLDGATHRVPSLRASESGLTPAEV